MEFSVVDRVVFCADRGIGNSIGQQSRSTEGCLFRKELQGVVQGTEQARTHVRAYVVCFDEVTAIRRARTFPHEA